MFGTSLPINLIRGSIVLLYVDILGMDVRAYAAVMIVYAVVDAVDNPVLGHLSDRTRSRFGRRRPWLLVGAPLLAASTIALFSPPAALDGTALVAWFAVFAILSELFDSMLNANYGALLPELFPEERRRALANVLRQAFQLVAMVISLALTPVLTTSLLGTEDSTEGFSRTALLYALVAVAAITVMALGAREELARRRADPPHPAAVDGGAARRLLRERGRDRALRRAAVRAPHPRTARRLRLPPPGRRAAQLRRGARGVAAGGAPARGAAHLAARVLGADRLLRPAPPRP
jgi:Na+/melibiose symporter-like transporter